MKTLCVNSMVLAAAIASGASSTLAATWTSEAEAAAACKAQAASQYADGERAARVKFKGIYGGADRLKVRMQVLPGEGRAFLAICDVSRSAHAVVGVSPATRSKRPAEVVAVR